MCIYDNEQFKRQTAGGHPSILDVWCVARTCRTNRNEPHTNGEWTKQRVKKTETEVRCAWLASPMNDNNEQIGCSMRRRRRRRRRHWCTCVHCANIADGAMITHEPKRSRLCLQMDRRKPHSAPSRVGRPQCLASCEAGNILFALARCLRSMATRLVAARIQVSLFTACSTRIPQRTSAARARRQREPSPSAVRGCWRSTCMPRIGS